MNIDNMNDEEKRIKIAEAVGWTDFQGIYGIPPGCSKPEGCPRHFASTVPNYLEDLNSMHEAEKTINNGSWWDMYYERLAEISDAEDNDSRSATARQRADAFLLTLP